MVLESLTTLKEAEKQPCQMIFFGALYATIAIILGVWIFKEEASLIIVFLTVLACIPLMYKSIKQEEKNINSIRKPIIKEHSKVLSFYIFLFLGFILAFTLWYTFLPESIINNLFSSQLKTIEIINSKVIGKVIETSFFFQVLANNIKVLIFCIFFSFFYGAGAIFILTWNATVISSAIGTFIRSNISKLASEFGLFKIASYFHIFSIGILKYMTHGIFEISAYFMGGLAGGIISVAVISHNIKSKKFKQVLMDSSDLIFLALITLILAAFIEAYVTPLLF